MAACGDGSGAEPSLTSAVTTTVPAVGATTPTGTSTTESAGVNLSEVLSADGYPQPEPSDQPMPYPEDFVLEPVTQAEIVTEVPGYAPGEAETVYTDPSSVETRTVRGASVILASPRALVSIARAGGAASAYFVFGATVLSHGGETYDDLNITDGTTDVGGLVGVSGRLKVGPSLAVRVDAEDHFYNAKFGNTSGARSGTKWQHDIVVALGVAIPF